MPLDRTFAILGQSSRLKPRTGPTLSGARGGDIQRFVDGVDTVVGELRPRCGAGRKIWNRDIDHRTLVIARCTTTSDVVAVLRAGIESGIRAEVRVHRNRL